MFYKKNLHKIRWLMLAFMTISVLSAILFERSWMVIVFILLGSSGLLIYSYQGIKNDQEALMLLHKKREFNDLKVIALLRQQLETLVTYLPYPLVLIEAYGKIELTNTSFRNLCEYHEDELTTKSRSIPIVIRKVINEVYLSEDSITTSIHHQGVDYQCISIPISYNERYHGCLVVLQDVTKLLIQQKDQKRFIADASHELKTPITAIKGMIEILTRDDFADDETQKEFLNQIQQQTYRLAKIVDDLLYLSKISNQRILIEKQPLDISAIIKEAVKTLSIKLEQNQLKVVIKKEDQSVVHADAPALLTVFLNLLDNACNYSFNNEIFIEITKDEYSSIIHITDHGTGIKTEDIPYIFDRFYRVYSDRNRATGGTGLGLAIVKDIIEAHQGSIEVTSVPSEKTTFTIKIPKLTQS